MSKRISYIKKKITIALKGMALISKTTFRTMTYMEATSTYAEVPINLNNVSFITLIPIYF